MAKSKRRKPSSAARARLLEGLSSQWFEPEPRQKVAFNVQDARAYLGLKIDEPPCVVPDGVFYTPLENAPHDSCAAMYHRVITYQNIARFHKQMASDAERNYALAANDIQRLYSIMDRQRAYSLVHDDEAYYYTRQSARALLKYYELKERQKNGQ